MSDIIKSIFLGIIQGLTEFLPVSSSGHLELAKYFLGTDFHGDESLTMSIILHIATALSTVVVFRKEIIELFRGVFIKGCTKEKAFLMKIIISMIPAGLIGFFLNDFIEGFFDGKIVFVSLMLLVTGVLLLLSEYLHKKEKDVNFKDSFIIGIAQAIAILPGISRSGATISTSLILGVQKEKAAFFSFIMVLPLIFGKMAKDILDGAYVHSSLSSGQMIFGFLAAFITGIFACSWMINLVKNSKLKYFAYYCFAIGIISLILFFANAH